MLDQPSEFMLRAESPTSPLKYWKFTPWGVSDQNGQIYKCEIRKKKPCRESQMIQAQSFKFQNCLNVIYLWEFFLYVEDYHHVNSI